MVYRYVTTAADAGRRLDQVLGSQPGAGSRTLARKLIELGGVHVDGRRARVCALILAAGQRIELYRDRGPLVPFRLEQGLVLHQDRYLIALNKPAGVETQPTPARYQGTLYEALRAWLGRDRGGGRRLEIGMAQRLDRDTSGVIAFSIHPAAHKSLTEQMGSRTAEKIYRGLVAGRPVPAAGRFVSRLARDRRTGTMKSVPRGGREAITEYRLVDSLGPVSLLELRLVTGRSHQIRAHLAEAGWPLLGDRPYGGPGEIDGVPLGRHLLHSHVLRLAHPVSGTRLELTAPLPADMVLPRCGR